MTPPLTEVEQDELDTLLAGQHPTVRARLATAWYLARKQRCGLCGEQATGYAAINDRRYCHGDFDSSPTCYERATRMRVWTKDGDLA